MLSRMLPHVIVTTPPVNPALEQTGRYRRSRHVGNSFPFIYHLLHRLCPDPTHVMRLAARSRVKRRLVQVYPPPLVSRFQHPRFKGGQIAIGIVQPLGTHDQDVAPPALAPASQ